MIYCIVPAYVQELPSLSCTWLSVCPEEMIDLIHSFFFFFNKNILYNLRNNKNKWPEAEISKTI